MDNQQYMHFAIEQARIAGEEVPVGAVLVGADGTVLSAAHNLREKLHDPTAHAEILAIREATAKQGIWRLDQATLFVTLEPCIMCAGAIVAARIPRVVFGAWDVRVGAAGSIYDVLRDSRLGKPLEVVSGVLEQECSSLLKQFFEAKR
jgi:tRNA(adenine34) deaminase